MVWKYRLYCSTTVMPATDNSGPPSLNWSPLENAAPGPMLEGDWTAQSGYQATQELIRSHRGRIFGRRGRQ
jgi:hypothetical protein